MSFHSIIIHEIVGPNYVVWVWLGKKSLQIFIKVIRIEHACIECKFQPHKLIGDVAYPLRPWMSRLLLAYFNFSLMFRNSSKFYER